MTSRKYLSASDKRYKVEKGQNREFLTKMNYCSQLLVGFEIIAHSFTKSVKGTRSTRKKSVSLGSINVGRTCYWLGANLEATYQRNGVLVRLRGGRGIVCTKIKGKSSTTRSKSKQLSPPIRRPTRNSSTQDSFHSLWTQKSVIIFQITKNA